MHSIGPPELFAIVPIAVIFFCIWKVYQMLSRINDNLARIRKALESASLLRW